jgi:Ca-activated chloride channel homolog
MSGRIVGFAVSVLVCLGVSTLPARQEPARFRGTSDNVPVFVTVTNRSGQLVTGLGRDAFDIRDQGKPRPLTVFDNAPQPVRLLVLIDVSGSMVGNLPLLRAACRELIAHLGSGDRARVGTFGRDVEISPTAFTADPSALLAALPATIDPSAPTPLWTAVNQAVGEFGDEQGRRVVLILSDGKDSGPMFGKKWVDLLTVSDRAVREDVMVYGVALHSRPAPGAFGPRAGANLAAMLADNMPDPGLGKLAEDTGGGYTEIRPRDDLATEFARIADELHQQYLLGFAPVSKDGKVHDIDVRLNQKDLKARARRSYRAPKSVTPG